MIPVKMGGRIERERERDLRVEEVLEQPSSKHRDWSLR